MADIYSTNTNETPSMGLPPVGTTPTTPTGLPPMIQTGLPPMIQTGTPPTTPMPPTTSTTPTGLSPITETTPITSTTPTGLSPITETTPTGLPPMIQTGLPPTTPTRSQTNIDESSLAASSYLPPSGGLPPMSSS